MHINMALSPPEAKESKIEEQAEEPAENIKLELQPCFTCGRTFVPQALKKHIKICEKMTVKKRNTFDSSHQRWKGTEIASYFPQNFGIVQSKLEKKSPPRTCMKAIMTVPKPKEVSPQLPQTQKLKPQMTNPLQQENTNSIIRKSIRLPSEQCPSCERFFGLKAYDRHVEWCMEKSRLKLLHKNTSQAPAKERLEARINYRAPSLKTKRAINREKYSSASPELNLSMPANLSKKKVSMTTSLDPSILINGNTISDYDPFISAQRQMDELSSSNSTKSKPKIVSKNKTLQTKYPSLIPIDGHDKGNNNLYFCRTLSLRNPRKIKNSKTLILNEKPLIKRSTSEEGPISMNFPKPEKSNERPVINVCVKEKILKPNITPTFVKRNSKTILNRRKLKFHNDKIDKKSNDVPLSKTDSLAIFLELENELKLDDKFSGPSEKDLKDKANSFNKHSSNKNTINEFIPNNEEKILSSLRNSLTNLFDNQVQTQYNSIVLNTFTMETSDNKPHNLTTEVKAIENSFETDETTENSIKEHDYINPNLINVCDNLPINVSQLTDPESSSSSNNSYQKKESENQKLSEIKENSTDRSNNERRNILNRQLRLNRNQFLYDFSPVSDIYSHECDRTISFIAPDANDLSLEPDFNENDLKEFLSNFDEDKQYPVFKDYKKFLSNSPFTSFNYKNENNLGIKLKLNKDNDYMTTIINYPVSEQTNYDFHFNNETIKLNKKDSCENLEFIEKIEKEKFEENIENLIEKSDIGNFCKQKRYPLRQSCGSRSSGDSAYSSLSRHRTSNDPRKKKNLLVDGQKDQTISSRNPLKTQNLEQSQRYNRTRQSSSSSTSSDTVSKQIQTENYADNKLSKFCHECGNKFVITSAKFCMECGVKRIYLK